MIDEVLFCRYLSNNCTYQERLQIKQWLSNNRQYTLAINDYKKIWQLSAVHENNAEIIFDVEKGWTELQKAISEKDASVREKNEYKYIGENDFPSRIRKFLNKSSII